MTPQQCRAARLLLGWTEQRLADEAASTRSGVRHFELLGTCPDPFVRRAIRAALVTGGVEFVEDGGGAVVRRRGEVA